MAKKKSIFGILGLVFLTSIITLGSVRLINHYNVNSKSFKELYRVDLNRELFDKCKRSYYVEDDNYFDLLEYDLDHVIKYDSASNTYYKKDITLSISYSFTFYVDDYDYVNIPYYEYDENYLCFDGLITLSINDSSISFVEVIFDLYSSECFSLVLSPITDNISDIDKDNGLNLYSGVFLSNKTFDNNYYNDMLLGSSIDRLIFYGNA